MKNQLLIYGLPIMLLTIFLSGCVVPQATDYFSGFYEANENTVLTVKNINGQIEIYTWDGDNVSFNAVKRSNFGQEELDKVFIEVTELENSIEIETSYSGSSTIRASVDMNIKIPSFVTVGSAETSNGAVQINDAKGDVEASSSNGAIIIDGVNGYVTASTSNGRIEVTNTTGVRDIQTSNGRITVEIPDFKEDIKIHTSNGRITVYINTDLNATIEMQTSNGNINIHDVELLTSETSDTYIKGTIGGGGNTIDIQTTNGDIHLYKLS